MKNTSKNFWQKLPLWGKAILIILAISIISLPFAKKDNKLPTTKKEIDIINHDSIALAAIKKESKVIEVIFTDAKACYISVEDDGTNRSGYAEYICQILKENKAAANSVKIVEVGTTKSPKRNNAYGILLGESNCY